MLRKTHFSVLLAIAAMIPCANADQYHVGDTSLSIYSVGCVGSAPGFRIWAATWGQLPPVRSPYSAVKFALKRRSEGFLNWNLEAPVDYPTTTLTSYQCASITSHGYYRIEVYATGSPNQQEVSWISDEQFAPHMQCPYGPQD